MNAKRWSGLLILALVTSGCFKQVVRTEKTPSQTVVEKAMVATWLWGLIPATPIDVRQQCPNGVAMVETQQNVMNGLVAILTLGIYSSRQVTITCAAAGGRTPDDALEVTVPDNASAEAINTALNDAVRASIDHDKAVIVRF